MQQAREAHFPLETRLFGSFEVRAGGHPPRRPLSRKERSLLALLALHPGRAYERSFLAGTLWPESGESQALWNLRQCIFHLRKSLGSQAHLLSSPTPRTLALASCGVWVDVAEFDRSIAEGGEASLKRAVDLYRGPLLEECLEEWALAEREEREQHYVAALEKLAEHEMECRNLAEAASLLRAAAQADPLRESIRHGLMEALAADGEFAAAVKAYRDFRVLLRRELNTDPGPELSALFVRIRDEARRKAIVSVAWSEAALERPQPAPGRIPHPLTELIGREEEVRKVAELLETARLVTLTGSAGIGKTRLAIAAAEAVSGSYSDGACFVELGSFSEGWLVAQGVATALNLRPAASLSVEEALGQTLSERELLLVLDNCEHLLDACAILSERLLLDCPGLRVLATSRQPLGIGGEAVVRVGPLSVPPAESRVSWQRDLLEELLTHDAPQLFIQRAGYANPEFKVTQTNSAALGQVCRQLDGIPLAIELAAARMKAMSLEQLAGRLDDRFALLTGGSRTAPLRQQTLEAAIGWSYDLLTEKERMLLRRLSVFAGGCTLGTAEGVCADGNAEGEKERGGKHHAATTRQGDTAPPAHSDQWRARKPWRHGESGVAPSPHPRNAASPSRLSPNEILDLLASLVDKSLVLYDEYADRYSLLETVRQYAAEKLDDCGEEAMLRQRHLEYYVGHPLIWNDSRRFEAASYVERYHQSEAERHNLRAALEWSLAEERNRLLGLELAAVSCYLLWEIPGRLREGREWLERLLAMDPDIPPAVRAKAVFAAATLAYNLGDSPAAERYANECLAAFREFKDWKRQGATLTILSCIAAGEGDLTSAASFGEECVDVALARGDACSLAWALCGLASVRRWQGEYAQARQLYEESLEIGRKLDEGVMAYALHDLGRTLVLLGDFDGARARIREGLLLWRRLASGLQVEHVRGLEAMAQLAHAERRYERMARLFGASEGLRELLEAPLPGVDRADYAGVCCARAALGEVAFSAAWAEGRAMSADAAIGYALEDGGRSTDSARHPSSIME